jgi:glycosyltransferase involved in cell wall biosynthesis
VKRCCLVVTTHARPDALACVLEAVAAQSSPPDELVIAEDGMDPETAQVVGRHEAAAPYAVRHLRQPHAGFRAGRIRNAAIARTGCEYVVLLDGDMVVHPQFLADHRASARPGYWSQGVRIRLDAGATRRLIARPGRLPGPWSRGLGLARRAYALRSPALAGALRLPANALVAVKACNQGFWRRDLIAANGFDESMSGWGSEDKELCARLGNAGVQRQTLLFAAVAWHLDHPPASRVHAGENRARWHETVRTGRTRCEAGIDTHLDR